MVEAARIAYRDYPTVVNEVGESSLSYDNNMGEYARMDSNMQNAQKAIGGSSDTAQLSQSYYWSKVANNEIDDECRQYYENTVILAVAAQLAIDGCKRLYEVDVNNDIERIRSQPCMKRKKDYPKFMKWTHEVAVTKNGKERPQNEIKKEKNKVKSRIDETLICPMNWLQDCLDKIQGAERRNVVDTLDYFIKYPGVANNRQMSKIRQLVEDYDASTRKMMILIQNDPNNVDYYNLLDLKSQEILSELNKLKITKYTMNRLIGATLGVDWGVKNQYKYKQSSKYTRKILTLLYRTNPELFLSNFR